MKRFEITHEHHAIKNEIAEMMNDAWEAGSTKHWEAAARRIENAIAAGREQFKKDLYHEATK